jgi:membrane-bound metal-dependent hydrolase YbcI (DUF457 family)
MFLGHLALGLAAKPVVPRLSLAVLLVAAQLADVLWPIFVAIGVERVRIDPGNTAFTPLDFVSYPYSHSLLFLVVWGVAMGWVWQARAPGDRRVLAILAALVVSHWLLDVATHRPDMPLYPGGPKLGLGLWNSIPGTMVVELAMYAVGIWIYLRATKPRDRVGRWAFTALAAFLVLVYFGNVAGPPPPSVTALWIAALVGAAILTLWAWWADSHRTAIGN